MTSDKSNYCSLVDLNAGQMFHFFDSDETFWAIECGSATPHGLSAYIDRDFEVHFGGALMPVVALGNGRLS